LQHQVVSRQRAGVLPDGAGSRESLAAPDLPVDVLVAVLRLVEVVRSAVAIEVRRGEQVRRRNESTRRLTRERAIQFIDAHPPLEVQRLCDGSDLIALLADALERRHRSITRRDLAWIACGGVDAGGLQ